MNADNRRFKKEESDQEQRVAQSLGFSNSAALGVRRGFIIAIVSRLRRMQNVSIKLDPAQVIALRKIAAMKSMPYQTLIRSWLAEGIRRELRGSER